MTQKELELKIQSLEAKNKELVEALRPFAETGKAVMSYKDDQMTMAGAQIPAKHFKNALDVLTKVEMSVKLRKIK